MDYLRARAKAEGREVEAVAVSILEQMVLEAEEEAKARQAVRRSPDGGDTEPTRPLP